MKWIPVRIELPKQDKEVLLFFGEDFPFDIGSMYKNNHWQRSNDSMGDFDNAPTHWMELPKPPSK